MRAVGPEFVLAQGDVLYFTGMVESLGRVCAEHGLEAVSDEHDSDSDDQGLDDDDEIEVGYVSDGTGADGSDAGYGSSDADAPRADVARRRDNAGVDVPASVPEMSELMEIQMMARSQAIGGVISPANANANGTARRKSDNGEIRKRLRRGSEGASRGRRRTRIPRRAGARATRARRPTDPARYDDPARPVRPRAVADGARTRTSHRRTRSRRWRPRWLWTLASVVRSRFIVAVASVRTARRQRRARITRRRVARRPKRWARRR